MENVAGQAATRRIGAMIRGDKEHETYRTTAISAIRNQGSLARIAIEQRILPYLQRKTKMPTFNQSPKAIHLQHKRELLLAERAFLKDKMLFVKKALQDVAEELSKLKRG